MEDVRIGIVGIGSMGTNHARNLVDGKVPGASLTAVCDTVPERLTEARENLGSDLKCFSDLDDFLKAEVVDAVLIATPHFHHPSIAMRCFTAGLHVITEKPAGVYAKQVQEMNAAAEASGKVFGIMYNQRTDPVYRKLREMVQSGEVGEIKRTNWIITAWYRPQSYFDAGGWRATWAGEGGGVLLNQDPHQLDLWQWCCGMPTRLRAFAYFGKYHDIEVEDDVTAFVEYANGATGVFVTSTADAPGTNRLEVTGNNGKVVIEDGKLVFWKLDVPERQFNREYTGGFGSPDVTRIEVPVEGEATQHAGIMKNFVDAIREGAELLAPGNEGIRGLSISNAMLLSAWSNNWVSVPCDEELFLTNLQERMENSKYRPDTIDRTMNVKGTYGSPSSK